MERREYIVNNEQSMQELVLEVLNRAHLLAAPTAAVLALNGDLGAGKTTFTKALAKELGVQESVTSPTFVIQKSYDIQKDNSNFKKIVHIDAYRLESGAEAEVLGLTATMADSTNLVVIEWAENIKSALPQSAISIDFKYINETTRGVTICS